MNQQCTTVHNGDGSIDHLSSEVFHNGSSQLNGTSRRRPRGEVGTALNTEAQLLVDALMRMPNGMEYLGVPGMHDCAELVLPDRASSYEAGGDIGRWTLFRGVLRQT